MISQAESEYGQMLDQLKLDYLHHPPAVKLPGGARWAVDYLVTGSDGTEFYVEVKAGLQCENYRLKLELYRLVQKDNDLPPLFVVKRYGKMKFYVIDEIGTEKVRCAI